MIYKWITHHISSLIRGGSRTAATSKVELFVIIVNGWKPLTIITKSSILDAAAVLDPPLLISFSDLEAILISRGVFRPCQTSIMDLNEKIVYDQKSLTFLTKISIIYIGHSLICTSDLLHKKIKRNYFVLSSCNQYFAVF